MEVFVINLDKNQGRLQNCEKEFAREGVSFRRFPAVYGKELPEDYKRKVVSRFRWYCASGRRPFDGEIGCALSHIGVWNKMREEGLDCVCVVEDDIVLYPHFAEQLARVEKWIRSDEPRVAFLFCHVKGLEDTKEFKIVEAKKTSYAECYVINRAAADAIVRVNTPMRVPIDAWPRWKKRGGVKCFYALPKVASQKMDEYKEVSDCYDFSYRPPVSRIGKLLMKLVRVSLRVVDVIWQ